MRRLAAVTSIVAAIVVPAGRAAAAEPTFSVSQSPDVVSYPGTTELAFRLSMLGGTAERSFHVQIHAPRYGPAARPEGSPLESSSIQRGITVSGAARAETASLSIAIPNCSASANLFHGTEPTGHGVEITLPANARGALTIRYRFGAYAPWPRARLAPTFVIGTRRLQPWGPRLRASKSGVRIDLRTTPPSAPTPRAARDTPSVPLGRAIRIRGRTEPRLRGQWIDLRTGPRSADTFARVRTSRRGRFLLLVAAATARRTPALGVLPVADAEHAVRPRLPALADRALAD